MNQTDQMWSQFGRSSIMRRNNKILAFLIAGSMMMSTLSGCSLVNDNGPVDVTETKKEEPKDGDTETVVVDMTDPKNDEYGKLYYAPVDEAHIAGDDYVRYIDNEILIVVKDGVTEEQVRELAEKYNSEIVGEIEVTGDYQLKVGEGLTIEELNNLIEIIGNESIIENSTLNYVSEFPVADDDADVRGFYYGEKWREEFHNLNDLQGLAWGIRVINTPGAWSALSASKRNVVPVKLGLIDGCFDTGHEDLEFAEAFYNDKVYKGDPAHGTHVAGTMAARCDDKKGICGVYPYGAGRLYGVVSSVTAEYYEATTMSEKLALAELIVRDVKVINSSRAWKWYEEPGFDKWYSKTSTDGHFKNHYQQVDIMGSFLQRMLDKDYDFVIVSAAGNNSRNIPDEFDCRFSSPYNGITEEKYPEVFNRIIVVGAVDYFLNVAVYSDGGDRVDIYAPGGDYVDVNELFKRPDFVSPGAALYDLATKDSKEMVLLGVFSTLPGNEYGMMQGTSMAAPHVAGVAAMVWSANNSLTGEEVKEYIKNNHNPLFTSYDMLDAERAVKAALGDSVTGDAHDPTHEIGTVIGCVTEEDGKSGIGKAKVTLTDVATGETFSVKTDPDGGFEIAVPEGKYDISVTADEADIYEWQDKKAFVGSMPVKKGEILRLKEVIRLKKILHINADGNVVFGNYEQDGDLGDGAEPIEWVVLDKNENGWLLISRYVLDCVQYNKDYSDVTWDTCSLRFWLNNDFVRKAFTAGEQALIPETSVVNSDFIANCGNDTLDKVFCLSMDELVKYYDFTYDQYSYIGYCKALIAESTAYAKKQGVWSHTISADNYEEFDAPRGYLTDCEGMTGAAWWLRTIGWDNDNACAIMPYGYAGADYEFGVTNENFGVRPVLYVKMPSENGSNEKESEDDQPTPEFKGKWVCTKETWYEYSSSFTNGVFRERREYEYDAYGNCVKLTFFKVNPLKGIESDNYQEFLYDSYGNLIKNTYFFDDGRIYYWYDYEYNSKGLMTKKIYNFHISAYDGVSFGNDYSSAEDIFEYDENGRLIKEIHYDSYGEITDWSEKVYDLAGKMIKDTYYEGDGSIRYWITFEYDVQENTLKKIIYDGDGKATHYFVIEYGALGNISKQIHYNTDDIITKIDLYEYDSSGNKTKYTEYNADGTVPYWEEYEYDADGNNTKLTTYGSHGHFINRYEYEYKYIQGNNELSVMDLARYGGDRKTSRVRWQGKHQYMGR